MNELKCKLLGIGIVKDNEYLDKYCELVINNKDTAYKIHKTQSHHIIPRYYYKNNDPTLDKDVNNKVNLLYKDHILAHYYLALCSSSTQLMSKNVSAVHKMTNITHTDFEGSPIEFFKGLDKYQELYEKYSVYQGDRLRGKKQTSEHIAQRIHKNTGQKRSSETKKKMGDWQRGKPKSEKARSNMKKAQIEYAKRETEEHKRNRVLKANQTKANWSDEYKANLSKRLSDAMRGRVASEQERLNKSIAMKGKSKSLEHRINLSRAKCKYRYIIHNNTFESTMEAKQYLQALTGVELTKTKWDTILNRDCEIQGIVIQKEKK